MQKFWGPILVTKTNLALAQNTLIALWPIQPPTRWAQCRLSPSPGYKGNHFRLVPTL
jgi:hypothetical protein